MKTLSIEQRRKAFFFEEEWIDNNSYWDVIANYLDVSVPTLKKWLRGQSPMPYDSYALLEDFLTFYPAYVQSTMFRNCQRDTDDIKAGDIIELK